MNPNFLEAWVNSKHRVLGKRLKPFCLSHAVALYVVESPYCSIFEPAMGDPEVNLSDLELAVGVCSSDGCDILNTLTRSTKDILWRVANRTIRDPKYEAKKFEEYFQDFVALPETFNKSEHESDSGAPWPLSIGVLLASKSVVSFDEAMTMPIGKAMWISATIGEQMGAIDILSDFEQSIIDKVLEERERLGLSRDGKFIDSRD